MLLTILASVMNLFAEEFPTKEFPIQIVLDLLNQPFWTKSRSTNYFG